MRLLRQPLFLAVAITHFSVDMLNSQLPLVLAVLSGPLRLSPANIGLLAAAYAFCGSLSQPLFGWLADRFSAGWLSAAGLLWMAIFFAGASTAPGPWALALLIVGALGSGAFHPVGTSQATRGGQTHMAGQAATAASIFFLFGQGGLSVGPIVGGRLLERFGPSGLLWLCALSLPVALYAARLVGQKRPAEHVTDISDDERPQPAAFHQGRAMLIAFGLMLALRAWTEQTVTTFIPKFYHDLGYAPSVYGAIAAAYMAGSACGGLAGGRLGDEWGKRRTIFVTLLLAVGPLYAFPLMRGPSIYALVFLTGAFTGASHSIAVVLAQSLMPRRMALASGLTLGFMFTSGALGAFFSGLLAEVVGLGIALQATSGLALGAALLSLTLKPDAQRLRAATVPAGD